MDTTNFDDVIKASNNNGSTFGETIALTNEADSPVLSSSGDNVYVAWTNSSGLFFTSTGDRGSNFENQINVGSSGAYPIVLRIDSSENNVYVAWSQLNLFDPTAPNGIMFKAGTTVSQNMTSTEISGE
jgi:hypothetical protein